MLGNVTNNKTTKKTKANTKIFLIICVGLLLIGLSVLTYTNTNIKNITKKEQIESIKVNEGQIQVKLNLPIYCSVSNIEVSEDPKNSNIANVKIDSKLDFSFKNAENAEINAYSLPYFKQINIENNEGKVIDTLKIK